jgi:hypothetical protein
MRAALLVTAMLVLAAPAQAQERLCQPPATPPRAPSAAEKKLAELEVSAARRAEFGFRHDLPYVEALSRKGLEWDYDHGDYMPVTKRELRYLELRGRLGYDEALERYLDRHPDLDGGTSVQDAWPKEPYLLVHVTREPEKQLAVLRRLASDPNHLRATKVRYSERELSRLAERIFGEKPDLNDAGFFLRGVGVNVDANRTEVELVTTRADAAAYFAQHYGPRVKTVIAATTFSTLECRNGDSFVIAPDGLGVTVNWSAVGGATTERLELAEFADRVEIGIVERMPTTEWWENNPAHTFVALSAPLGHRPVIDAKSGKPMLQIGPGPGDPPCPISPPSSAPTRLEQAIATRREEGLRADPAYVRKRLNSGALHTRAELRWLAKRDDLGADRTLTDPYVLEHSDEYGGVSIKGAFPARPYIVYRWTAHRARHEAALKRLSKHPGRVFTAPAQHSVGEVRDLEERIRDDWFYEGPFFDGYGRTGLLVTGVWADDTAVHIEVITARADSSDYFSARYGPLARVQVVGDRFECPPLQPQAPAIGP